MTKPKVSRFLQTRESCESLVSDSSFALFSIPYIIIGSADRTFVGGNVVHIYYEAIVLLSIDAFHLQQSTKNRLLRLRVRATRAHTKHSLPTQAERAKFQRNKSFIHPMIATAESPPAQRLSSPSFSSSSHNNTDHTSTYYCEEEPTKHYYEARVLLVVVFGFGILDAILRQGLPPSTQ